jgi:hypothetical protein
MLKKIHKFGIIFIAMTCISMIGIGIWSVDIGVSGMRIGRETTSGYWDRDSIQQYHLGLYLIEISTLLLVSLIIFAVIWRDEK